MLRSAVAMNNIAVAFLEKRCYKQAMETCKDCLLILKETTADIQSASLQDIQAKLNAAILRLCRPVSTHLLEPDSLALGTLSTTTLADSPGLPLLGRSTDECSSKLWCVQIDHDADMSSCEGDEGPAVVSAIVLHNYALACLFMSKVVESASTRDRIFNNAFKLLLASHAVVLSLGSFGIDAFYTLQLEAIVLRACLAMIPPSLSVTDELHNKILRLQHVTREICGPEQLLYGSQGAPAA